MPRPQSLSAIGVRLNGIRVLSRHVRKAWANRIRSEISMPTCEAWLSYVGPMPNSAASGRSSQTGRSSGASSHISGSMRVVSRKRLGRFSLPSDASGDEERRGRRGQRPAKHPALRVFASLLRIRFVWPASESAQGSLTLVEVGLRRHDGIRARGGKDCRS